MYRQTINIFTTIEWKNNSDKSKIKNKKRLCHVDNKHITMWIVTGNSLNIHPYNNVSFKQSQSETVNNALKVYK